MTIETLSSADDDGPRRRLPRWVLPVIALAAVGIAVAGLVVRQHRADEQRALRLAALDDGQLGPTITGGGTGPGQASMDIAIRNTGHHAVVVGSASTTVTGVSVESSTMAGHSVPPGATLTDELQLRVRCPAAADVKSGGQVRISFTTAAHRRHILVVDLPADPHDPAGEAMTIIRSVCGAVDAAGATTVDVAQITPKGQAVDVTVVVTNSGRSTLTVKAITLGDDRLRLTLAPPLPLSIKPRADVRIRWRVTVGRCGPEINHDGSTFIVDTVNELGDSVGNNSDDQLDLAFRRLVSVRCPNG